MSPWYQKDSDQNDKLELTLIHSSLCSGMWSKILYLLSC